MAKKPRAAKSNKLGLKNKAKTAARRAAKAKGKPKAKAAAKTKGKAPKAKSAAQSKAAGFSKKHPVPAKPVKAAAPAKAMPSVKPMVKPAVKPAAKPQTKSAELLKANTPGQANDQEIANRLLFSLSKDAAPAIPEVAITKPTAPTENFFHSKAKALRDENARQSQHAHDQKHGGFNARLPGAQKGRRGK